MPDADSQSPKSDFMANPKLLTPVAGDDPCGRDLRWDSAFTGLMDALAAAATEDAGLVLEAQVARSDRRTFEEIVNMAAELSARTKDVRVLAVYAEASWHEGGLAAFAGAMEDMVAVLETWPGPADGVHPRADEDDGDLGERAAALGRLLNRIPALSASIGWSVGTGEQRKAESSATLRGVFGRWKDRLEAPVGADLPSASEAWKSLQGLVVASDASDGLAGEVEAAGTEPGAPASAPAVSVWDLIDRAAEQMTRQDRHSPALPVLQLLAGWRSFDIVEIADAMKQSGISLEQLLESVKKQTRPTS